MSETYTQMMKRHHDEFNKFPIGAAFSNDQFDEMMRKWGLKPTDTDKIIHLYGGSFIRKSDRDAFFEMTERHKKEFEDAIKNDATGEGFIKQMFYYELCNHEYSYTMDPEDTLDALGYTAEQILADDRLKKGFQLAEAEAREVGW